MIREAAKKAIIILEELKIHYSIVEKLLIEQILIRCLIISVYATVAKKQQQHATVYLAVAC